jgi:hypothetical protein
MKPICTLLLFFVTIHLIAQPCSTSNGLNCYCPDSSATHCELLPDLAVSRDILLEAGLNPEIDGELRLSVATPNIGFGPLEVHASYYFVCGTDTVYQPGGMTTCPDGSYPRQLIQQTVYSKNASEISSLWRWAGSMTYHPTHGHMHVDSWCNFSLRLPIDGDPNPLNWPIIAEGSKLGFCLMDYGSCEYYNGYCRNTNDEIINSSNLPNYGMGGGGYSCGLNQGISAGWTDIYHHYLDDMDIPIGPEVCDGDYYLVVEVDPNNNFRETNEDNNVMAVPFTLSKQNGSPENLISSTGFLTVCQGENYQLTAMNTDNFVWNTGDSTTTISVTEPGDYYVIATTECAIIVSDSFHLNTLDANIAEILNDTLCAAGIAQLSTTADGDIAWYDAPTGGNLVGTGNVLITPEISNTTTFYAEQVKTFEGIVQYNEPHDNTIGNGGVNGAAFNGSVIFNAYQPFLLKSVKVYLPTSEAEGERTIQVVQVVGSDENIIATATVFIPHGESRLQLNFEIPTGENYQLKAAEHPGLWRTSDGVTYPYTIENIVSIIGSNYDDPTQGAYRYYYYYDWEVKSPDYLCQSTERTPATAVVMNCVDIAASPSPNAYLQVTPNPNNGYCQIQLNMPTSNAPTYLSLHDITGKIVWQQSVYKNNYNLPLDMQGLSAGVYMLQVKHETKLYTQKIVRY